MKDQSVDNVVAAAKHRRKQTLLIWLAPAASLVWLMLYEAIKNLEYMMAGTSVFEKKALFYSIVAGVAFIVYLNLSEVFNPEMSALDEQIVMDMSMYIPEILDQLPTPDKNISKYVDLAEAIVRSNAINIEHYLDKFKTGKVDPNSATITPGFFEAPDSNPKLKRYFNEETAVLPWLNKFLSQSNANLINLRILDNIPSPVFTPRLHMRLNEKQTTKCQALVKEIDSFRDKTKTKLSLIG